jgi:hypothetical protein
LDEQACAWAAAKGHLEVLRFLHEQGCPWNEEACMKAAAKGHLDTLRYLHEQGCPWDERACIEAAKNGHIEVLQFLHNRGCPWTDECYYATIRGWYAKWCTSTPIDTAKAPRPRHVAVLRYLYKAGCPFDAEDDMLSKILFDTMRIKWRLKKQARRGEMEFAF